MCAWLILITNGEWSLQVSAYKHSKVTMTDDYRETLNITCDDEQDALILYSPDEEYSVKYKGNLEIVLKHLRVEGTSLEISRTDSVSYQDYDAGFHGEASGLCGRGRKTVSWNCSGRGRNAV